MNLLFFSHYPDLYGANRSLFSLVKAFQDEGHQVCIVLPRHGEFFEYCVKEKIPVIIRKFDIAYCTFKERGFFRFVKRLTALPRILKVIKTKNPDIVYVNSLVIDLPAMASVLLGQKFIWHIRETGSLDYNVHYDFRSGLMSWLLKRSLQVISISKFVERFMQSEYNVDSKVVYNGIQLPQALYKNKKEEKTIYGLVGLIHPGKNQLNIVKAFLEMNHENSELFIYGSGEGVYYEKVKSLCDSSKGIHFKGFEKKIERIFEQIHYLIMSSENEAMGRVTIEAFAYGVPVIANNTGASPELVEPENNGFLYQGTNALKSLIARCSEMSREDYQTLSQQAIDSAKKYAVSDYTSKVIQLVQAI